MERARTESRRPAPGDLFAVACLALACALSACRTPSMADEEEIGRKMNAQVYQNVLILHDDVLETYIDDIGQRLVHAAGPQPYEYTFTVVEDDDINAFAIFGGQIFVHTGLILRVRNVSELAGVIGHEIGHVVKRHLAQNLKRQQEMGMLRNAAVLGSVIAGVNPGAVDLISQFSTIGVLNSFGREMEEEADAFAVEVVPRAGYDPNGIVSMFELLQAGNQRHPPKFFSDHPATKERIDATKALIAAKTLPPNLKRDDNGKLEIIQHRIRLLTGEGRTKPTKH